MKTKLDRIWKLIKTNRSLTIAMIITVLTLLICIVVFVRTLNRKKPIQGEVSPYVTTQTENIVSSATKYNICEFSSTSVMKDLRICFTDGTENNIPVKGIKFRVKLIDPSQSAQLISNVLDINAIDEEIDKLTPEELSTSILNTKKSEALLAYAKTLSSIEGTEYEDEDMDGEIYAKDIKPGDYTLCFYPVDNYTPTDYTKLATVREKVQYKVVDGITKTFKVYTASEDIPVKQIASLKDTIEYVESSSKVNGVAATPKKVSGHASLSGGEIRNISITMNRVDETDSSKEPSETNSTNTNSDTQGMPSSKTVVVSLQLADVSADANSVTAEARINFEAGSNSVTIESVAVDGTKQKGSSAKLSKGTHTITVNMSASTLLGDGDTKTNYEGTESQTFNVTVSEPTGAADALTDENGNKLYKDTACTIPATQADYIQNSEATYYKQSTVYYGWQTVNGARYFYDKEGNKVTGVQVIQGATYNFGTDGVMLISGTGIDVSKYQGDIDWDKVKNNVSFAIIRCGFRATKTGAIIEDPYYRTYIKGAKKAGIATGIYFYSTALNEAEAIEEASAAVALADTMGGCSLPIYIDMEDNVRGQNKLTNVQRTAICKAFCETVKSAGYTPGVYASQSWLTYSINTNEFGSDVNIWVAEYKKTCTYKGRYNIWQYGTGKIDGISGLVDMNIRY